DHLEGGVGLAAVLGANAEEDEVAATELDVDDGGPIGDVLFAEQPAGSQDLGCRVLGDHTHLRIADIGAPKDRSGFEPESFTWTHAERQRVSRLDLCVEQGAGSIEATVADVA